jgi:prepilin peptidase CpaA
LAAAVAGRNMFANLFVSQAALAAFVGLLIAVAISDLRSLTIPNRYSVAIALLYPIYAVAAPLGVDWVDGVIVGAIALGIGFLLFAMRFAGGGDVKFFAAVSLWAGSHHVAELAVVTALVGGVLALVMIIRRRLTAPRTTANAGFVARVMAFVSLLLGWLLMSRARRFGIAVSTAYPGSSGAEPAHPEPQSNPAGSQPVGTLPYGAAISVGGIVVAAMLLMRG